MRYPIVEQIAAKALERIRGITEDNGYNFSLASAVRPTRYGNWKPTHLAALLTQADPEADDASTFSSDGWTCEFQAHAALRESDDSQLAIDTLINVLAADLQRALCTDRKFGGLADSLDIVGQTKWREAGFAGVTVRFVVHYAHKKGDPFTQANEAEAEG